MYQQRGFPLRNHFIPGCVGSGLDLGLRVCLSSSVSAGGVWKSGILLPWDWGWKTGFLNGLPHNRTTVSGSWTEIGGAHTSCLRSVFPCMSKTTWELLFRRIWNVRVGPWYWTFKNAFFFGIWGIGGCHFPQILDFQHKVVRALRMSSY